MLTFIHAQTLAVFENGRRLKTSLLYTLLFCCMGLLSVYAQKGATLEVNPSPWTAELKTFHQLLKTDADAARTELQRVAPTLFDGHTLVEEWIPLYFRVLRDGTEHPSDIQRIHELEIRMLTAIDADKHAVPIQYHREALKHAETLTSAGDDPLRAPKSTDSDGKAGTSERGTSPAASETTAHQHYVNFHERLPHDVDAARTELDAFATLAFHGHPRTEEWKALFFRFSLQKEVTILEMIQYCELQTQMLKDINPEKHAKEIANFESVLKQMKFTAKIFEQQGILETEKVVFNMKPGDK